MMGMSGGQRPRRYMAPDRAAAVQQTARRHGPASFQRELLRAHRIDRMIKGVETGNPWDSLLEMALGLAGKPVLDEAVA
jgi:DNA polymerase-3 subunit delta